MLIALPVLLKEIILHWDSQQQLLHLCKLTEPREQPFSLMMSISSGMVNVLYVEIFIFKFIYYYYHLYCFTFSPSIFLSHSDQIL